MSPMMERLSSLEVLSLSTSEGLVSSRKQHNHDRLQYICNMCVCNVVNSPGKEDAGTM